MMMLIKLLQEMSFTRQNLRFFLGGGGTYDFTTSRTELHEYTRTRTVTIGTAS